MPQQRSIPDITIDIILYSVVAYFGNPGKSPDLIKRICFSLLIGVGVVLVKILISPITDSWKEKLRKRRREKRDLQN